MLPRGVPDSLQGFSWVLLKVLGFGNRAGGVANVSKPLLLNSSVFILKSIYSTDGSSRADMARKARMTERTISELP